MLCFTIFTSGFSALQLLRGRVQLRPADVRRAVNHLPMQVARVHRVEVHQPQRAHSRRRQVQPAASPVRPCPRTAPSPPSAAAGPPSPLPAGSGAANTAQSLHASTAGKVTAAVASATVAMTISSGQRTPSVNTLQIPHPPCGATKSERRSAQQAHLPGRQVPPRAQLPTRYRGNDR